jgi:chitodextrinase
VISPLVYGSSYVDPAGTSNDRYFVRAVDPGGNRSASTARLSPGDNTAPTTPGNLGAVVNPDASVDLTWTASTDNVGVTEYLVYRNGVVILTVPGADTTVNLPDLGPGAHWLQVRALDAAGNQSFKTPPVRVDIESNVDTQRPTQPGNPTAEVDAATGIITFGWTASADNVAVTGYNVRRNLDLVGTVDGTALTIDLDLGLGGHYLQVEAFDAAGNVSYRTAPVFVEVDDGTDTENPSVPTGLTAVEGAGASIDVAWTASTDNVGVSSYQILRNGVEVLVTDGETTTANVTGLGSGLHFIQVRAFDAAGNQSYKTPPVEVTIAAADTSAPSTPSNLQVVVEADSTLTVSWGASTDNVGVTGYRVLRNLAEVALVDGSTSTTNVDLGAGDHWIQVQALDAAGNASFRTAPVMVAV